MRLFALMAVLWCVTTSTVASPIPLAVSPDGRYVVRAALVRRPELIQSKRKPEPGIKSWVAGVELFDRQKNETTKLSGADIGGGDMGAPPATRLPEFRAIWSPDSRYLAISGPFNELVVVHNMSPGADMAGTMSVDPHSESVVYLFRCASKVKYVDLPQAETLAITPRPVIQRGEVVDHWEGTSTLWTADCRNGKLFRYRIHRRIFPSVNQAVRDKIAGRRSHTPQKFRLASPSSARRRPTGGTRPSPSSAPPA